MNKIPRITKCESIAKMTNDEVKIMILEKQIENQAEIIRKQSEKIIPENLDLHNRINKAIEKLRLCNSECAKETIDILRGEDNEEDSNTNR